MRKRILSLCFLLSVFLIASCQSHTKYHDSFSVDELAESAQRKLLDVQFVPAESDYLEDYVTIPEDFSDFCIYFSANGSNLDEFGIWRVASTQTNEAKKLLEAYLSTSFERNRAFYDSYIPQETPKLRDAEVKVFGNYVAYAVLSPEDKNLFFASLEGDLRI